MPENNFNDKNDFIDLPKTSKDTELPNLANEMPKITEGSEENKEENKPIIEIPQEFYDQLAKEEQEKKLKEAEQQELMKESKEASDALSKMFGLVILNAIAIFALFLLTIHVKEFFILGIPIYIVALSIYGAITEKKDSTAPASIMVGGISVSVITFIMSMVQENNADIWMYYSAGSAIAGFVGLILSSIITKLVADLKNVKALETIGYIIVVGAFIGVPIFLYNKYPEDFYKIVFQKQTTVTAQTPDEFVVKTLKNRYNIEFTCDESTIKHFINEKRQKGTTRMCKDKLGNEEFEVIAIAYNEGEEQHIVLDQYLNKIYIEKVKQELAVTLTKATGATAIELFFYPEQKCAFVGDCADCDEYYARYEEENSIESLYKNSVNLNFSKEIKYTNPKDFINNNKFKVLLALKGTYPVSTDFNTIITLAMNALNSSGLKNTYGFEIAIRDFKDDLYDKEVYKAKGTTNDQKLFKDPTVFEQK